MLPLGHTEVIDQAIAPTCTESGKTEGKHCSACDTVIVAQTTIDSLGHTEIIDQAIAPTCTESGKTEGKHCSACDTVIVAQTTIAPLGHTEVIDQAIAPTCTESGKTEGKHCSVCYVVIIKQNVVSPNGHTFLDGVCLVCNDKDPNFTPSIDDFDYDDVPEWAGDNYYVVNDNTPFFTESEIKGVSFETYSPLDYLGRAQVALASIGKDLMPTTDRPGLSYKPTGWVQNTYPTSILPQTYIYNRSHLIAWSLTAEGDNKLNLITGTPYFNQIGMQIFERMVVDYIKETNNHVMYRVTPIYVDKDLVARGVLMEAWSVEDNGDGICFNVFMYNVQPHITIDYATGKNWLTPTDEETVEGKQATLITNISHLTPGTKVVIVAKAYDYALGSLQNTNNRTAVSITKSGNTVTVPFDAQIITIASGLSSGTYALNVGTGYLYSASSSSNWLRTESSITANSSWSITISSSGVATIKSTGSNTRNWLRYNDGNKIFSSYGSTNNQYDICLYMITE